MKVLIFLFLILINPTKLIYTFSLIFGTILACSSSSWIIAWVGLEINLISFTPILINNLRSANIELTIKYFLVQAIASMIVIIIATTSNFNINSSIIIDQNILLIIRLAIKAGVAPFHFWFPQIIAYADWSQAVVVITWQKIAPIILLSFTLNFFTPFLIISSALVGILGGLNQTSLKKILTYSSIIHSAWIISIIYINSFLWWLYFIVYSLLTISVIIPNSILQLNDINRINSIKIQLKTKIIIFINLLSLAGLPPFIGFSIKIISINAILYSNFRILILSILIFSSLVAFYFYSRLIYSSILIFQNISKLMYSSNKITKLLTISLMLSFLGNIFLSILVLLS